MVTKVMKRTADAAAKVLCLALVLMLTFSAVSPLAVIAEDVPPEPQLPDEYYVGDGECEDDEAYIEPEEETEPETPEDDTISDPSQIPEIYWGDMTPVPGYLWWEEGYVPLEPFSAVGLPTLTGRLINMTSTSVTLEGEITSTGGANIFVRGFWIRPANDPNDLRELLVFDNSNPFSRVITGLTPGTEYVARAIARNVDRPMDTGQSQPEIRFTTPSGGGQPTVPGAPQNFTATAGDEQVVLSWSAPASNGGSPIIRYEVSIDGVMPWMQADSNAGHTFRFLENDRTYTFRVRAVNAVGFGADVSRQATPFTLVPQVTVFLDANEGTFAGAFDAELNMYELNMYEFDMLEFGDSDEDIVEFIEISPMSSLMSRNVPIGMLTTLLPRPIRNEHSWVGWSLTRAGTTLIPSVLAIHSNATMYAAWQPDPVITYPSTNGAGVFANNLPLTVTWRAVPGATYQVTLTNVSTSHIPIERQTISGTSFTIPQGLLGVGQTFTFEVFATVGTRVSHSLRTFVVRPTPGIRVTVRNPWGTPLQGALVHVMRGGNNTAPVGQTARLEVARRTDANGVAFFTNEEIRTLGRYGINVTHPQFAATYTTSTLFTNIGTEANPVWERRPDFFRRTEHVDIVQYVEFVFQNNPALEFRLFGWGPVLPNMNTVRYENNSVFGWREDPALGGFDWHNGIDLRLPTPGAIRDYPILSAFRGQVEGIFRNINSAGHGLIIRYQNEHNGFTYYMRYMHMIEPPRVSSGIVYRGQHIGNVGNTDGGTARSGGYHLHIDVGRVRNGETFAPRDNRHQQLDPRAFFAEGFADPRPQMRILP